ncbi:hypothetical protein BGC07_14515 [Piscirickettsia litoralis]|uniref:Uncharacterized protein n=1 Tax=Piscirickettsia litoralis TaxID=1891921 RepID=A0ABX3A8I3_9GAMM|nr:hypothetical protein BGC07_14515 [Piscirickettsia litoralis]
MKSLLPDVVMLKEEPAPATDSNNNQSNNNNNQSNNNNNQSNNNNNQSNNDNTQTKPKLNNNEVVSKLAGIYQRLNIKEKKLEGLEKNLTLKKKVRTAIVSRLIS